MFAVTGATGAGMRLAGATPERSRSAACQFEALLLAQMLRHMRESGQAGWQGDGTDTAGDRLMEVAEEQLAQALSASGGLGLAELVTKNLSR